MLVLADGDGRALESLGAELSVGGGSVVAVPTDLGNAVSVRRLVEQTFGAFGRVDVAVNCTQATLAMKYEIPLNAEGWWGCIVNVAHGGDSVGVTRLSGDSGIRINMVSGSPVGSLRQLYGFAAAAWKASRKACGRSVGAGVWGC